MKAGYLQLIGAVPFLCHIIGNAVAELPDAVVDKRLSLFPRTGMSHSVHHLGVISKAVMSPLQEMVFRPGFRSGKSCGWKKTLTYRVPGIYYPVQKLVNFRLSNTLELHEGRLKEVEL